ncbi:hypothetical protein FQA39_LY12637 [Lamprigera yunnana]|nr:hypothetical protein FQA39_LY12637 [Lamprigera yunnana]
MAENNGESEYSKQYFEFTPETFYQDFCEMLVEEMSNIIKQSIVDTLHLKSTDEEIVQQRIWKVRNEWYEHAKMVLKNAEPKIKSFFTIPKNVLLDSDVNYKTSYIEDDIKSLEKEVASLEDQYAKKLQELNLLEATNLKLDSLEPFAKRVDEAAAKLKPIQDNIKEIKELEKCYNLYLKTKKLFDDSNSEIIWRRTRKRPASILQELAIKKHCPLPKYTVRESKEGARPSEFHCEVVIDTVVTEGFGKSKHEAKHEAASNALKKLAELNEYTPEPDETTIEPSRSERTDSHIKLSVNYIGKLNEMCIDKKVPLPIFSQISDQGTSHYKEFTFECKIASIVTQGTANAKKQAQHLAAKEMMDRLMESSHLFDSLQVYTSTPATAVLDSNVSENLESIKRPKHNFLNIKEYHHLKDIVKEKGLNIDILKEYLHKQPDEATLKEFLTFFELDYCIETLSKTPYVVVLHLNSRHHFAVIASDSNYELSVKKVLQRTFEDLDILLISSFAELWKKLYMEPVIIQLMKLQNIFDVEVKSDAQSRYG